MASPATKDLEVHCDDTGALAVLLKMRGRRMTRIKPPMLGKVRFADPDDAPAAFGLCTEAMKQTFRVENVEKITYLIENAVLAITQLTDNGEIIGMLVAREYPQIPSIHPTAWEEYLWARYKVKDLNSRNTLFLHLLCWDDRYSRDVVENMLRTVYMHDTYVQYIAFTKTSLRYPQLVPGTSRPEAMFRRVQAMERGVPGSRLPMLLVADRKETCPRLRVRRAVEEDNDDIVPIVEQHSKILREMYGDYYVSELIARHPTSDRVLLVGEHQEVAVGIMILSTQINFESLEESFELSPFAGLRHLDKPPHKHRTTRDPDTTSLVSDIPGEVQESSYMLDADGSETKNTSQGTSVTHLDHEAQEKKESAVVPGSQMPMMFGVDDGHALDAILEYLDRFVEEEEEVEFDIVNIPPELLKVPGLPPTIDNISKNVIASRQKEIEPGDDILVPRKEKRSNASEPPKSYADYIIRYSGAPNAFLLEMFAMHPDYDERLGLDILEAAYDMFPDRDYCIACLPSSHVSFPLLEHFTLVTPHYTRLRFINDSLYVAHVNSVRGDLAVRLTEPADMPGMFNILEHVPRREAMTDLVEQTLNSASFDSYVLLSEKQPIGVVAVGPLEDGEKIRASYDLEPKPRRPGNDGIILGGVMSPVFEAHGRWFLREVMRQSRYSSLFWVCQPFARGDQSPRRNMMSLAEKMVPVRPHRIISNLSGHKELESIFKEREFPFAVWIIERPLTSMPKVFVNDSIVVIGASTTGLSFIENLFMGPSSKYLTFTNVTLISTHGLPTVTECLKAADKCVPIEGRFTDYYLKCVPYAMYIDIIVGVINAIDRKKKCVHMLNGGVKYYDKLVITCGQQFQHPEYLSEPLERAKEVLKGKPCERILMDDPKYQPDRVPPPPEMPINLFVINSLLQANQVLRRLMKMMKDSKHKPSPDHPIVVYGDRIESYCCMSALLELGVPSANIVFIENFPPDDPSALRVNCFNDETIDERVQERLKSLGIKVLRKFRLDKLYTHHKKVTKICLMDPLHALRIHCFAMFFYGLKAIDLNAFKAINESGLVYDGGLVVSPKFETNDPSIFGAGPCCNYSRRLYASSQNHKHYNSEDIGLAMATMFLRRLDPFISFNPEYNDVSSDNLPRYASSVFRRSHPSIPDVRLSRFSLLAQPAMCWQPAMKFTSPIVKYAVLPGPYYYMKVRMPGEDIPMEARLTMPRQGHTLVTDKFTNYFKIHLNTLHCVDMVTCLSHDPFDHEIITQLYGKHEAMFNRLLLRFQIDQIDDLYVYFKQPWMAAMYQESFSKLLTNINYHEIGAVYNVMRSRYAMVGNVEEDEDKLPRQSRHLSTCFTVPECKEEVARRQATFRSVIDRYVLRSSAQLERDFGEGDIPSECGQSPEMRNEASGFWKACGGEDIVFHHVASHLAKYVVPNPHYALTNMQFFPEYLKERQDAEKDLIVLKKKN